MTDTPESAPAGWYPDPEGSSAQRYFDGDQWTEHYHNADAPGAPTEPGGPPVYASASTAKLSPIEYWKKAMLQNYANFKGRARRSEYWWTYLINVVGLLAIVVIGSLINDSLGGILYILGALAIIIPTLAVTVRRLHDTGKSAWFLLIGLIPLIGGLIMIFFMATDGDRAANEYGGPTK